MSRAGGPGGDLARGALRSTAWARGRDAPTPTRWEATWGERGAKRPRTVLLITLLAKALTTAPATARRPWRASLWRRRSRRQRYGR